jgi:hypothetical protein
MPMVHFIDFYQKSLSGPARRVARRFVQGLGQV